MRTPSDFRNFYLGPSTELSGYPEHAHAYKTNAKMSRIFHPQDTEHIQSKLIQQITNQAPNPPKKSTMSKSFEVFSSTFVGVAKISAKAGKGDAVAQALAAIKASATSAAEPGCLGYHIVRFQEEFIVFEKYVLPLSSSLHLRSISLLLARFVLGIDSCLRNRYTSVSALKEE